MFGKKRVQTSQTPVGLDMGVNSCKAVALKRHGDRYELLSWQIEPIHGGEREKAIGTILKKLSVAHPSPVTALVGKGTLIRYIEMPLMSPQDLKQSFALEADRYFPFPQDQIYTDCFILERKEKESRMQVLVAAVKKELVDERIRLLNAAGVHPEVITLNSIAIANIINVLEPADALPNPADRAGGHKAVAVLDFGETVSNLTIIVDLWPRFTRDIFIGGRDLTKSISNALGIDYEQAEQLKYHPENRQAEILSACDTALATLDSELRLSFDYFITERNIPISELRIIGGGALLTGLGDILTRDTGVKTILWDPFSYIDTTHSQQPLESVNANRLAVALGLALSAP
jgi:type IV pilus assembly protein PilM